MTVRENRAFLSEQYGTDMSHDFISSVTDAVMAEAGSWQQRPLEPMCAVIFFDALRLKIRDEGLVRNKANIWRWAYYPYALHKPHLPSGGSTVYRGISGEQFHGSKAS